MEWCGCGKIKGKQREEYVKRAVIEKNSKLNTSTSDFCCVLRSGDAFSCNFGVNSSLQSLLSKLVRFLHRYLQPSPGENLSP